MKLLRLINEATGDKNFDAMMNDIESSGKQAAAFHTKIRDAAEDTPDLIKKQKELEKWIKSELEKIRDIPNKMLHAHKDELKPLLKWYREDVNILEALFFHASDKRKHGYNKDLDASEKELQELADHFIKQHADDIKDVMIAWLAAFDKLKKEANQKDWPTGKESWAHRDVSNFINERHFAREIIEVLRHHVE